MSHAAAQISGVVQSFHNIAALEFEYLERFGTYPRLHFQERTLSNLAELQYAGKFARIFRERGAKSGEKVLLLLPNSPELTASLQGTWMTGASALPVMPQWPSALIAYALQNSGASIFLTVPALAGRAQEAATGVATLKHLLVLGESESPASRDISSELAAAPPMESAVDVQPESMALLLYTSGTTAKPKGVVLSHTNIAAALRSMMLVNQDVPKLAIIHPLPLSHVFGMLMLMVANAWGLESVLLPQFDPLALFTEVQRHRVGYLPAVPTMLVYMLHHPQRNGYDLSSLRRIIAGGDALPEQLRQQAEQELRCRVEQGYGMSENFATACHYADNETYRPGSVGRASPGIELRIVDDHDSPVAPGIAGEICLRGDNITPGYWQDEAANHEAFRSGWFHTGDVGYLDRDEYLYITDRKKDLIVKGGENVSPHEIEEAIYLHPAVAEVAVIGIPDRIYGQEICAVIQLRPGIVIGDEEMRQHVAGRVGNFKVPARFLFRDGLPKTVSGKIHKQAIRQQLCGV